MKRHLLTSVAFCAVLLGSLPAAAEPIAKPSFQRVWARTDQPVAALKVSRTWMWGPEAYSNAVQEPYADAPGGRRLVQYFDKSRMEINDPNDDPNAEWYVTNGLLAAELITGRMQFGEEHFRQFPPARVNVAGDLDDSNGVTYASFSGLLGKTPLPAGSIVTQTIDHNGVVMDGGALGQLLAEYGVTARDEDAPTGHTIASVFWDFMTSSGLVYDAASGGYVTDTLALNPFYVAGYPLTEPYWTIVRLNGEPTRVLVQVFERRVLTYTPNNPDGWTVEAGNVGQHYYTWRYGQLGNPIPQ